ncbi:cytochrome c oxidase assembly factor 1 homolog isoform X2 [Denticeps clupeoides]|uniref:cytochrome c oxidase assembly factor 1 homolog isoform X2 n=1 Tax=Denticeps clupeoides TaxID=299321 RepID=UPI0010A40E0E|nr:cytochrome c oxidase assembly factor 1 homolog isoform X2 [Denticeps clupeoides]
MHVCDLHCLIKKFAASEYHRLALECLNAHTTAMENLGAPPLKVHNLHLTDRYNSMDQTRAQIKIPVTGSKTGGYLYATSIRDAQINRWHLQEAILQLRDGKQIDIFSIHQHKRD